MMEGGRWGRRIGLMLVLVLLAGGVHTLRAGESSPAPAAADQWVDVTPPLHPPGLAPAMVYDEARGETVLVGVEASSGTSEGQTWTWDGARWTLRAGVKAVRDGKEVPPPRVFAAAATYDARGERVMLFGGTDNPAGAGVRAETWLWDGHNWEQPVVSTPVPRARQGASMVYDAANDQVVLFGGSTVVHTGNAVPGRALPTVGFGCPTGCSYLHLGDTWVWDRERKQWTEKLVPGPPPRTGAAMAYDARTKRVVLFGGCTGAPAPAPLNAIECSDGRTALRDSWVWDGSAWTEKTADGGPQPRFGAGAAYDPIAQHVVLHGGGTSWVSQQDPAGTPLPSTTVPSANGLPYRTPAVPAVPYRADLADTWTWDGMKWNAKVGTSPTPTRFFGFVYDKRHGELLRTGGKVMGKPICDPTYVSISERPYLGQDCRLNETWAFGVPAPPQLDSVTPSLLVPGTSNATLMMKGRHLGSATVSVAGTGVSVEATMRRGRNEVAAVVSLRDDAPVGAREVTVVTPGGRSSCSNCFAVGPPEAIVEIEGDTSPPVQGADLTPTVVADRLRSGEVARLIDRFEGASTILAEKRVPAGATGVIFNAEETDQELQVEGEGDHALELSVVTDDGHVRVTSAPFVYRLDLSAPRPPIVRLTDPITSRDEIISVQVELDEPGLVEIVVDDDDPETAAFRLDHPDLTTAISTGAFASGFRDGEITAAVTATDRYGNRGQPQVVTSLKIPEEKLVAVNPPSGPNTGGHQVVITAKGVRGARSVRFGDQAATFTQQSPYRLLATTPRHSVGPVDVVIETATTKVTLPYLYVAGRWTGTQPLTSCAAAGDLVGSCRARYLHTATLLDGPACRQENPASYCGNVLVVGGTADYIALPGGPGRCKLKNGYFMSDWIPDYISPQLQPDADLPGTARQCVHNLGIRSAQLYDPQSGRWAPAGNMMSMRFAHTATLLDGPECQVRASVAPAHCGKVLVAGGQGAAGEGLASGELYDPERNLWVPGGSMALPRFHHTATMLYRDGCSTCTEVFVAGGATYEPRRAVASSSTEVYDPIRNVWTLGPPMAEPRVNHTATRLMTGEVFVAGGFSGKLADYVSADTVDPPLIAGHPGALVATTELYTPAVAGPGSWRTAAPLAVPRHSHTATLLTGGSCGDKCGRVLIFGGLGSNRQLIAPSGELFDRDGTTEIAKGVAQEGRFEATPFAAAPRSGHTATLLPSGQVLVAGAGNLFPSRPMPAGLSAEVFDPGHNRWFEVEYMSQARGAHTATLLAGPACRARAAPAYCGAVLVAGGRAEEMPTATAELFIPPPSVSAVSPGRGGRNGGGEVTLTGSGFVRGASVSLGGLSLDPADVDVRSSTEIVVVPPPRVTAGRVEVAVTTASGTSGALALQPVVHFEYVGAPGRVNDLSAAPLSTVSVRLQFTTPSDGSERGLANRFIVKQASAPMNSRADFAEASALCGGECVFKPGLTVYLDVEDLEPGRSYYYAVQAVNEFGEFGEISDSVEATTATAHAPARCPSVSPRGSSVLYRAGYSLIGLPGGSVVPAASPLYGWLDQGAGGAYSIRPAVAPVASGHGYWAWFACPTILDLAAPGSTSVILPLGAYHASMVGNPSGTAPATVTGHDFAARWDPSLNAGVGGYHVSGYREAQTLAVGEGLWVFSYEPTTVALDATPG